MAQNVQVNVTADAGGAIGEFNKVITASKNVERSLRDLGKAGFDSEKVLENIGAQGEGFQAVITDAKAAGASIAEIKQQLLEYAQQQKQTAVEGKSAAIAEAREKKQAAIEEAAVQKDIKEMRQQMAQERKEQAREEHEAQQQAERDANLAKVAAEAQAQALMSLSRSALGMAQSILNTTAAFEQQRAKLSGLYHDTDLAKAKFQEFVQFASKTPFEVKSVVDAAIKIQSFGQDASKVLPIAGDLAARFGRDIPDAAQALGKALSGSQDGVQVLIDSFGVSRAKLKEFGASVDSQGQVLLRGEQNLGRFRDAIGKIAKADWAGGMDQQMDTLDGKMSNFRDAMEQVKATMGSSFLPVVKDGAAGLTSMLSSLNENYPALLQIGGGAIAAGAAVTSLSAGVVALRLSLMLAGAAFTATTGYMTLVVGAGLAVNAMLHDMIENYKEIDKASVQTSQSILAVSKAHREWAGKNADELHRLGVTAKDAADVIRGLDEEVNFLHEQGFNDNDKRIMRLKQEKGAWRELAEELGAYDKAAREAAEMERKAAEERATAIKIAQDLAKAEEGILQARVESAQLELQTAETAGKATLAQRQAVIDAEMMLEQKRHEDALQKVRDEIKVQQDAHNATPQFLEAATREMDSINATHVNAVAKYEAQKADLARESERRRLQYVTDRIAAEVQANQDLIAMLEAQGRMGIDTTKALAEARQQADALAMQSEQQRHEQAMADLRKLGGDTLAMQAEEAKHAESMAHIRSQARLRELQAAQQVHDAIIALSNDETKKREDDLLKQVEAFRAAGAAEASIAEFVAAKRKQFADDDRRKAADLQKAKDDILKQGISDEEARLKERAALGENTTQDEIALIQKRHAIERSEIKAQLEDDAKKYQSRAEAEALMNARLEENQRKEAMEVRAVGKARVDWVDAYIKKLEELKAKQDNSFGSGPYSMDEFFKRQKLGNLGNTDETKAALKNMGLAEGTDIDSLIASLRAGASLPGAEKAAQERNKAVEQAVTQTTNNNTHQPINIYIDGGKVTGASSGAAGKLLDALNDVQRDLRYSR